VGGEDDENVIGDRCPSTYGDVTPGDDRELNELGVGDNSCE
jgi:hypothetical protein